MIRARFIGGTWDGKERELDRAFPIYVVPLPMKADLFESIASNAIQVRPPDQRYCLLHAYNDSGALLHLYVLEEPTKEPTP